jgi:hypothetical protein
MQALKKAKGPLAVKVDKIVVILISTIEHGTAHTHLWGYCAVDCQG